MALKFIIFDLDDTLYPGGNGVMEEVGRRIQQWLGEQLGLSAREAVTLRRKYYRQYGTTLAGLIEEQHDADIEHYLAFVHDIPIEEYLRADPALDAMLGSIPLRKVVYTNATSEYGWRVLRTLGVAHHFEQVIGIEEVNLLNKPYHEPYEQVLELLEAEGSECIMVEDSARNLGPAKALGMATVLVKGGGWMEQTALSDRSDESVDFVVESVLEVGPVVDELLRCEDSASGS